VRQPARRGICDSLAEPTLDLGVEIGIRLEPALLVAQREPVLDDGIGVGPSLARSVCRC
jgi:hypothetical protein